MRKGKFEYWENAWSKWYFHLVAPNGKIICDSEGYNTKRACLNGIKAVQKYSLSAEVIKG